MSVKESQMESKKPTSSLHKLFSRQQPKVKAKKNMARLLCQFAEEDHLKIAKLIQAWLDKDKR
jgi:predicted transcriptional regulator